MSVEASLWFATINQFVVWLGIPFGVLLWRNRNCPIWVKLLTTYLIVCFSAFLLSRTKSLGVTENEVHAIYGMFEMAFLFFIYRNLFGNQPRRLLVWTILILLTIGAAWNLLFIQKGGINSYSFTAQAFIYSVLGIVYFFHLLRFPPVVMIQRFPPFWFNVGVLVYFAGNLVLFTLTHYLVHQLNDDLLIYWDFHNLLFTIGTGFMCFSLWLEYRLQKSR